MKIVGIGVDIVDNQRVKNSIKKKNFITRVFTKNEIIISKNTKDKKNFYAK